MEWGSHLYFLPLFQHPVSRSTLVPDVVELGNGESTAAQEEDEDFSGTTLEPQIKFQISTVYI